MSIFSSFAFFRIASARGCVDPLSAIAAIFSTLVLFFPIISVTSGFPFVNVPVLSKTTVSSLPTISSTPPFLIKTPCSAPFPIPTMIAVGVAIPKAQGQAMTNTETIAVRAKMNSDLNRKNQSANAIIDIKTTNGTKKFTTLSAIL